jgi:hypothetical protein
MLAALVTLNPVGMLCFNQPIAPNLPPLVPSLLCSPSNWQSCIGRRSSRCRQHRARLHTGRRGDRRLPAVAYHYYGPGFEAAAGPGVVTPRRLAPTCPAAPSPGLECKHLPVVACINAIQLLSQQLHAAASRTSQNRIKNPAGYIAGYRWIGTWIVLDK